MPLGAALAAPDGGFMLDFEGVVCSDLVTEKYGVSIYCSAVELCEEKNTHPWFSCSARFLMLIAIILQVKFSMRSAFGSWVLALVYSFHIWVASGSFFCMSSGLSKPAPPASFLKVGNRECSSMPLRAAVSAGVNSSLVSWVVEEVRDGSVSSDPGEQSKGPVEGNRTCLGEEDDVAKGGGSANAPMAGASKKSERGEARRPPPRSPYCAPDMANDRGGWCCARCLSVVVCANSLTDLIDPNNGETFLGFCSKVLVEREKEREGYSDTDRDVLGVCGRGSGTGAIGSNQQQQPATSSSNQHPAAPPQKTAQLSTAVQPVRARN